jgi:transcriptional regulator NrdR family protein
MSKSMSCPKCGGMNSLTTDSRPAGNTTIRRRRTCTACQTRWTTYEYSSGDIEALRLMATELNAARALFAGLNERLQAIGRIVDALDA